MLTFKPVKAVDGKVYRSMNNPFFYFEVWLGANNKLIGSQLNINEYQELIERGYYLHSFTGRRATVAVVNSNPFITRSHKLDFAITFMEGKLVRTDVDLNKLTITTTVLNPPP